MQEAQPVEDGERAAPSLPHYIATSSQNSRIELPKQIATSSQNIGPINAAGTSNAFVSPTIYGYNNNSGSNANSSGSNYEDFVHLGNDLLLVDVNDTCEFPAPDQYPKNGPIRPSHRDSMSSQENEREPFDDNHSNSSTSIDFDWFHLKSIIFLNWHFHNFNLFKLLSFLQLFFNVHVQIYFSQISLLNTAYSQAMQNDFILTQYEILIIWPIWFVLVLLNKIILQNGLNFSQNMLMRLWDTLVN